MDTQTSARRATQATVAKPLSAEDVQRMYSLIKGSTSVELKITVPDALRRTVVERMKFDPVEAQPRTAYFFDTPDLALSKAGIVVGRDAFKAGPVTQSSSSGLSSLLLSTPNCAVPPRSKLNLMRCRWLCLLCLIQRGVYRSGGF